MKTVVIDVEGDLTLTVPETPAEAERADWRPDEEDAEEAAQRALGASGFQVRFAE